MNKKLIFLTFFIFVNVATSQRLQQYNVDPSSLTVSGFSSGAFMATQFHFAYSNEIGGAGIIAGVPNCCAINGVDSVNTCVMDPTNVNVTYLITIVNRLANYGLIDPVANIRDDKVYIFHGQNDVAVYPESGQNVLNMYTNYGADIQTEFSFNVGHGFPSIYNIGYNGAFIMLNHLYGGLTLPAYNSGNLTNLLTFNQAEFFAREPIYSSMGTSGYIYVPTACRNGERCRLHITFHGCKQYSDSIGNTYIRVIGMMEVAEVNNIIVLFPQTTAVPDYNPLGCWDWYGFVNVWFPTKVGDQTRATHLMMNRVVYG